MTQIQPLETQMHFIAALLVLLPSFAFADLAPSPRLECPNSARLDGAQAEAFFDALPAKATSHADGDITVQVKEVAVSGASLTCTKIVNKAGKTVAYNRGLKPNCVFSGSSPSSKK